VVIKAQVLVGGRGKAGGIRLVRSPEEAEEVTTQILSMRIKDLPVRKVLVDEVKAAAARTDVFLLDSAIGYYGSTGSQIITEQASAGNDFLALVSEEWEASTAPVEAMGLRRAVARIGLVLSTEEGALRRLLLPARLFAGGWFGSGKQWWSWVHIADTVSALRFLLEQNSAQGAFNVTAPNPVTNKEFGRVLGTVLNRPSLLPVPAFALNLALGEVATTVLDGQRVVPERLLEQGFSFAYPQLEGALRNLIDGERIGGQAPARQTAG
ncbi:MAG: TIGR01777 family oxidoreductase, partial [Candidatus Promineifilaceae bacterium]